MEQYKTKPPKGVRPHENPVFSKTNNFNLGNFCLKLICCHMVSLKVGYLEQGCKCD